MSIYIPPNCITLDKAIEPQIRLGIQGYGGTGKTWSALTFLNPIIANVDRGLGAHIGRKDVIEIPFWNIDFCKSLKADYTPYDLKDLIYKWIDKEGRKLEPEQTFIFDGNTGLQNAYHKWYSANLVLTKKGVVDDFAEYQLKLSYYRQIAELLKTLRCHVIFLAHEAEKKDKDGSYTGKIRPLISGQFGDEMMSHFTDWFRQLSAAKPNPDTFPEDKLKSWKMTRDEFRAMLGTFPDETIYFWQTQGDDIFDAKCSSLVDYPRLMPANYNSFSKYRRKSL